MRNPIWPMWPCACCDAASTHRDEAGNARCEEHRLSEDIETMDAERLRRLVRKLLDKNPYPNEECKNCLCNMRSGCELQQEWNRKKAGL